MSNCNAQTCVLVNTNLYNDVNITVGRLLAGVINKITTNKRRNIFVQSGWSSGEEQPLLVNYLAC